MDRQSTTEPREAQKGRGKRARRQRKPGANTQEGVEGVDVQASPDTIVEGNQRRRRAERGDE